MSGSSTWFALRKDSWEASRMLATLVVQFLSMLTGEDQFFSKAELFRRVEAGDANVLAPVIRADGGESERRREEVVRILASAYYLVLFFHLEPQYSPLRVVLVKWKAFGPVCKTVAGDPSLAQFAARLRVLTQRKLLGGAFFLEKDLVGMVYEWCSDANVVYAPTSAAPFQQPLSSEGLPELSAATFPAVTTMVSTGSAQGLNSTVVAAPAGTESMISTTIASSPVSLASVVGTSTVPATSSASANPTVSANVVTMPSSASTFSASTPVAVLGALAPSVSIFSQEQLLPTMDPTSVDLSCIGLLPCLFARHASLSGGIKNPTLLGILSRLRTGGLSAPTFMLLAQVLEREMRLTPFSDLSVLDDVLSMVTAYYLWPQPYSAQAFRLLKSISREIKCPGIAWRRDLERVFPFLAHKPSTGKELEVILMSPPDSYLSAALEAHRVPRPTNEAILCGLVLSLYRAAGLNTDAFEAHVLAFGPKRLLGLYDKIREAMEASLEISSKLDAAVYHEQRLDQLRRATERHAIGKTLMEDTSSQLLCGTPWQYRSSNFTFDVTLAGREMGSTKLPRRNATKVLRELIAEYGKLSDGIEPISLRIMVEGGDWEFHHVLTSFVSVSFSPDTAELLRTKLKLSFFLVPNRRPSVLADALRAHDPWFARTTSVVTRAIVALGPGSPSSSEDHVNANSFLEPGFLLHSTFGEYVSAARYRNEFKIWQCECWQKSAAGKDDLGSKYIIPFILGASLGQSAQGGLFQLLNDISLGMGNVYESRAFKFVPPILSFKMIGSSLRGVAKEAQEWEARPWEEVTMSVLPEASGIDTGRYGVSWVEVRAAPGGEVVDSKKKKRQQGYRPLLYHARRIEVNGHKNSTFDITLDGVPYGPFTKVVISPCSADGNAQDPQFLTVPVQSFFGIPGISSYVED